MFVETVSVGWLIKQTTICKLSESKVESAPDLIYCATPTGVASYRKVFSAVASLVRELGSDVEDRDVGILLPNGLSFLVAYRKVLKTDGRPGLINKGDRLRRLDRTRSNAALIAGMTVSLSGCFMTAACHQWAS